MIEQTLSHPISFLFLFIPLSHASFLPLPNQNYLTLSLYKSKSHSHFLRRNNITMVEKEDLALSLSLNFFHKPHPLNLISSSGRGIDVNRLPSTITEHEEEEEEEEEEETGVSSPNSTVSSVSGKRSEREGGNISDDEDAETARKKLRLSKNQSAILEETFKQHNTLNPKQKLALAKQLGLRPRQVEVWFQNRRARTKLKQTEVDCEVLKRCCENLTDENRRLHKEVQELRALKLSPQFYMQMTPPTTLTMCPSCERVAVPSSGVDAIAQAQAQAQAHHRAVQMGPWASAAAPAHRMFDVFRQ